ncbi:MAG: L-2-amino-thiazoline-4-carboxylic acid hydrolase, partial [Bradymonadaceae bacterium]
HGPGRTGLAGSIQFGNPELVAGQAFTVALTDPATTGLLLARFDEVWDRYYELEPDLPVADSLGATFTTHLAVATLAVFEVLRDHGVDRNHAYEIIYDTGWRLYTTIGEPPLLVASAYTRDPAKRLKIATDLFRFFPFGEPGYRWEDVEGPPQIVGFDCVRCPVAEYFARQDESELCVHTWCRLDFPLAEKWGGRLERTGTIASGAPRCDFRWHADVDDHKPPHGDER